ncbi:MAG: hypothetical protein WCV79_02935 [Candidatus Paceibacterota bacterium]|jgi:hypothetical protein
MIINDDTSEEAKEVLINDSPEEAEEIIEIANDHGSVKRQKSELSLSHPILLRTVEAVRTWIGSTEHMFYVPQLA